MSSIRVSSKRSGSTSASRVSFGYTSTICQIEPTTDAGLYPQQLRSVEAHCCGLSDRISIPSTPSSSTVEAESRSPSVRALATFRSVERSSSNCSDVLRRRSSNGLRRFFLRNTVRRGLESTFQRVRAVLLLLRHLLLASRWGWLFGQTCRLLDQRRPVFRNG